MSDDNICYMLTGLIDAAKCTCNITGLFSPVIIYTQACVILPFHTQISPKHLLTIIWYWIGVPDLAILHSSQFVQLIRLDYVIRPICLGHAGVFIL